MNLPYMVNRIEIAFWTALVSVLQDRRSAGRIKYLLLAVFCVALLLLGLFWARLPDRPAIPAAVPQGVAPLVRPSNGQSNLLVVMVDRLDSRRPQLLSVWVLGRMPSLPQVTFLPIYPARPPASPMPDAAASAAPAAGVIDLPVEFAYSEAGGLPADFSAALRQRSLWWDHYLILDQPALTRLVDLLGGMEIDGRWLDGRQASALAVDAIEPFNAYSLHLQLMQQICAQSSRLSRKSAADVINEFADLVASDLPAERLQAVLRGLQAGGAACNFPTAAGR